jgi:hypothetical protein
MPTTFERQNGALSRPSAAHDFTTCSDYERSTIAQTGRARSPSAPQKTYNAANFCRAKPNPSLADSSSNFNALL